MRSFRFLTILLFIVLTTIISNAQNPVLTDEQKLKQKRQLDLIEQILADTKNLKLAENRALIYAQTGNLFWGTDEKRARRLFQASIDELINAQNLAESSKKNAAYMNDLIMSQSLRPNILQIVGNRDAELALASLARSRPSKIVKALAEFPANVEKKSASGYSTELYLVQQETGLEQRLTALAADQNPERAVRLLKEALKRPITYDTLNLLKKLHQKDSAAADEIADEVLQKLLKVDYDDPKNGNSLNAAISLLSEAARERSEGEKSLVFDETRTRNLADLIISSMLEASDRNNWYSLAALITIAQKLAPSRVEVLKQKSAKFNGFNGFGYNSEAAELLQGDATAEKLITEADKFPANYKQQLYVKAASKYAEQGNFELARKTLTGNLSDDELENALASFNWQMAMKATGEGRFDAALEYIDLLPENSRFNSLLELANAVYQKNPENKTYAVSILERARAFVSDKPEDSTEMSYLFNLISAYAAIEPNEAFRLFESLIPQISALSDASALLGGFNRSSNVRQGEFIITYSNAFGLYLGEIDTALRNLTKADFDRTIKLTDAFERRETRIYLKLKLAENVIN
jgi:hypothetical protein